MHYLLSCTFVGGVTEKREPHREEHLAMAQPAHDRDDLLMAGALREPADGAVPVFRTERPSAIEDLARTDPCVIHGWSRSGRCGPGVSVSEAECRRLASADR